MSAAQKSKKQKSQKSTEHYQPYIPADLHPDSLLNKKQVAVLLHISEVSLNRLLAANKFPEPIAIGARVCRWRLKTVTAWLAERESEAA